ncbi:MAG: CRISPR-associated protein Csn2-St [Streptococcus sp.]|nr:CRISPR-associated protein Csn2-St [Streptococcus sp.]
MKWYFTHPYKESLSINFGKFTQVVGEDTQLKYYLWQILIWYFDGKKYSVEDLELFQQNEPQIISDGDVLKRTDYKLFYISDIQNLVEQMIYKKGTVAFEYLKIKFNNLDIVDQIDCINDKLDYISSIMNTKLNIQIGDIVYHTESQYFNAEQLILKNFLPYFSIKEKNISFEFIDNKIKFLIFLELLSEILKQSSKKIILMLKNIDDYLDYSSFIDCCNQMKKLTEIFKNFHVIIFPSNEGYLYVNRENIEYINIISGLVTHYYEFSFLYDRFIGHYPSNNIPTEEEFLKILQKISSYLFNSELNHISLSTVDLASINILNKLYHYDKSINYYFQHVDPLLLNFLSNKD